ncbi:MAG: hypothetical protein HY815_32460 [Candidatus Riflebacteria bacterium]|nr:hypothetical protein [Candidatus Riflebacteria bacterium]
MRRSRRAFSLVEMVVATFIVLEVIVVVSRMLSTSCWPGPAVLVAASARAAAPVTRP